MVNQINLEINGPVPTPPAPCHKVHANVGQVFALQAPNRDWAVMLCRVGFGEYRLITLSGTYGGGNWFSDRIFRDNDDMSLVWAQLHGDDKTWAAAQSVDIKVQL